MSTFVKRLSYPSQTADDDQKRQLLCKAIEQDWQFLQGTIQVYVKKRCSKLGLAADSELVQTAASEIFHETVETAIKNVQRFDPTRLPRLWLLGIAANKVKEWGRDRLRDRNKVTPIAEIAQIRSSAQQTEAVLSEDEMFGLLYSVSEQLKHQDRNAFNELLSLVEGDDRTILQLFYSEGLQGKDLAARLSTSVGAIHVRLSRARQKLHEALVRDEKQGGKN